MAQDSIAYGESLLADIRQRNDKLRSQAKKEQKRNLWKAAAVKIGTDVVSDIFTQRQEAFLQNEKAAQNKIMLGELEKEARDWNTTFQTAQKEPGGELKYLQGVAKSSVEAHLRGQYGPQGTYNEADFQMLLNKTSKAYLPTLQEQWESRKEANKVYLSSGNKEAYEKYLENKKKEVGFTGSIIKGLGLDGLTGKPADGILSTSTFLDKAEKQRELINSYNKAKNAGVAEFISENYTEKDLKLGVPSPVVSDTARKIKVSTATGDFVEHEIYQVTQKGPDGKTVTSGFVFADGSAYNSASPETLGVQQDFDNNVAIQIKNDNTQLGTVKLRNSNPARFAEIEELVTESVRDKYYPTDPNFKVEVESRYNEMAGYITQGGYQAKFEGWGTLSDGAEIQASMIHDSLKNDTAQRMPISGLGNPFNTMFKIDTISDNLASGNLGISKIVSNGVSLYDNLKGIQDVEKRNDIETQFFNMNYFTGEGAQEAPSRLRATKSFLAVKYAVDNRLNPREYNGGKAGMLAYAEAKVMEELQNQNSSTAQQTIEGVKDATPKTGVEDVTTLGLSEVPMPEGEPKVKTARGSKWSSPQHREYSELNKASELIAELEAKAADPEVIEAPKASKNLKRRIAVAKANFVALKNKYLESYSNL